MPTPVLASEIDDSILAYKARLRVPTLRAGQPQMLVRQTAAGPQNDLLVLQGGFARVFRWTDEQRRERAVRCFYTAPQPEYAQRYIDIDQFFRRHIPHITTEFRFHEQGLMVKRGDAQILMPLIEMEWVEGETLLARVDRLASARDKAGLLRLAGRWMELLATMRQAGIAHGDLSGENVMVRAHDGSLVLIDYDGVFLPAFAGQRSDQAGNPAYQHPDLNSRPYDHRMDNFAALVIYIALQALAHQPDLWGVYTVQEDGKVVSDNLLFKREDLQNPSQSALFTDLTRLAAPPLVRLVQALQRSCREPLAAVPDFLALVDPQALELETQLQRGVAGEEAALAVWLRGGFHTTELGQTYTARISPIQQRIEQLQQRRKLARAALDKALANGAPQQIVAAVAQPDIDLTDLPPAQQAVVGRLQAQAAQARQLRVLVAAGDDPGALAAWEQAGFSTSPFAPAFTDHIAFIRRRWDRFQQLDQAIRTLGAADGDQRILAGWDTALFDGYAPAEAHRPAYQAAIERHQRLEAFLRIIHQRSDRETIRAWEQVKDSPAAQPYATVVTQARQNLAAAHQRALAHLRVQLVVGDDQAVLAAWADPNLQHDDPQARRLIPQIETVQARRAVLTQVQALLADESQEEAALTLWEAHRLDHTALGAQLQAAIAQTRLRHRVLNAVEKAIQDSNDGSLLTAWDDTLFRGYRRAQKWEPQVSAAHTRMGNLRALEAALQRGDDRLVMVLWDRVKVGELPGGSGYSADVRARKERWLATRGPRNLQGGLEEGRLHLQWDWPEGLAWVAVTARPDRTAHSPGLDTPDQWTWHVHRVQYERRGFTQPIPGDPAELYIRLFPLTAHEGIWFSNPTMAPVQLRVRATRIVPYQLVKTADGEYQLDFDATHAGVLPILVIVASPERPAVHSGAGTPIGRVESLHYGADSHYRVPLRLAGWPTPTYLGVFPANLDDTGWLSLQPAGGTPILITR
ncbi:MAG: hypothetical protein M3Z04_21060 [Chloroflexota bacterium]|nr:hypothetical protein [Chloroflexota bacterium]